jgi:hypothetical protein
LGLPVSCTAWALAGPHGIPLMYRMYFLIVTAVIEVGTGFFLLILPSLPLELLFGIGQSAPESLLFARLAGAALLALGVASWMGRSDKHGPSQIGLMMGILIYDAAAALLLTYAALFMSLVGIALWPAVVLHSTLAVWCVICLRATP